MVTVLQRSYGHTVDESDVSLFRVPEKSLERFFEKPTKRKNDTFLCFSFIERNNTGNKHHAPRT